MALSSFNPKRPVNALAAICNPHNFRVTAQAHGLTLNLYPYTFRDDRRNCVREVEERTALLMKEEQPVLLEVLPHAKGVLLQETMEALSAEHRDWSDEEVFRAAWKAATKREAPSYDQVDAANEAMRLIHERLLSQWKVSADPTWSYQKCEAVLRDPKLAWTGPDDLGEGPSAEEVEQQEIALTNLRKKKAAHDYQAAKHAAERAPDGVQPEAVGAGRSVA